MKRLNYFILTVAMLSITASCSGEKNNESENLSVKQAEEVFVYYFHNERRCATCRAVESESEKAVKELYGDDVSFEAYNLGTSEGQQKAKEVGTPGQALLIISGDKKINITNEAFMNARSNPDKLKQIIKDKIDPLIN